MTERSATTTIRLYETDSHLMRFTATVLSCERTKNGYDIVLERTAFFPTGGGQPCDGGTLDGLPVLDVKIEGETVHHTLPAPLSVGSEVTGEIDREIRLRHMANHSGEHILSSVIAKCHGLSNVGFHMGSKDVTCDFNGILDEAALRVVEDEVNRIIRENHPITASYPSSETLASLDYHSKLALTENVRIVAIGEDGCIDRCACCAPHVASTGEIGILRIVESEHYKGGLRLHILCGADALDRIRDDAACIAALSILLSAKPEGQAVGDAVLHLCEENKALKDTLSQLNNALNERICATLTPSATPLCLFDSRSDPTVLRKLATMAMETVQSTVAVFGGDDNEGYKFVLCADSGLNALYADLSKALPCRGGGSDSLICGSVKTEKTAIEATFQALVS
jgi:alanyl-tRNA synthetase